jgi:hypothetical protein
MRVDQRHGWTGFDANCRQPQFFGMPVVGVAAVRGASRRLHGQARGTAVRY